MTVFFTSDLHLGHKLASRSRGFGTDVEAHDRHIIKSINSIVRSKDKLFILGDVAFTNAGLYHLAGLHCKTLELIFGNHDLSYDRYVPFFQKMGGFREYKNFHLSHCPIHPLELNSMGNIHGHVHCSSPNFGAFGDKYVNVNVEATNFIPLAFEEIQKQFM